MNKAMPRPSHAHMYSVQLCTVIKEKVKCLMTELNKYVNMRDLKMTVIGHT